MARSRIMIFILVGLVAVCFFALPKSKTGRNSTAAALAASVDVSGMLDVLQSINTIRRDKLSPVRIGELRDQLKEKHSMRNPFALLMQTEIVEVVEEPEPNLEPDEAFLVGEFPAIQLQGVIYERRNPEASIAFIDGAELNIGAVIDGWKIIEMEDDTVIFKKSKTVHVLKMYEKS